jgi:hypothetical protein
MAAVAFVGGEAAVWLLRRGMALDLWTLERGGVGE